MNYPTVFNEINSIAASLEGKLIRKKTHCAAKILTFFSISTGSEDSVK
jgi:hypothetical protein